jgi:adenylosuccinate synthase
VNVRERLLISPRAHLVLPGHRALDVAREAARGAGRIGTTGRGIGPAYESRAARTGVRAGLIRHPQRLREAVAESSRELELAVRRHQGAAVPTADEIEAAIGAALALAPMVGDVSLALAGAVERGEPIMFEGAQGTMLDLDHGTYPFVTSSSVLAGSAAPACGLPARTVDGVLAVFKAYTTRVGAGPFPTELTGALGEQIRRRGNEFGATTGRPRRTGWFDAVAARAAVRWNGIDAVALTKLDVLDDLPRSRSHAYRAGDAGWPSFRTTSPTSRGCAPVYERCPAGERRPSASPSRRSSRARPPLRQAARGAARRAGGVDLDRAAARGDHRSPHRAARRLAPAAAVSRARQARVADSRYDVRPSRRPAA